MSVQYEHLLDIPWAHETADCLALFRRFYADNWNIQIPDFAYPLAWAVRNPELDLVRTNFQACGFAPVDVTPQTIRTGDALFMQTGPGVRVVNHCAVYLGAGWFLHQPFREKSRKDLWAGGWLNATMITARHPDVQVYDTRPRVDLRSLLPSAKREKYRDR